jgi:hypothetical protein
MDRFTEEDVKRSKPAELCADLRTLIYIQQEIEKKVSEIVANAAVEGIPVDEFFCFIRFQYCRKPEISPVDEFNVNQVVAVQFLNVGRFNEDNKMGISDKGSKKTGRLGGDSGEIEPGWF